MSREDKISGQYAHKKQYNRIHAIHFIMSIIVLRSPNAGIRSMASYSNLGAIMTLHPSALIPYTDPNATEDNKDGHRPRAQFERMTMLNKKFSSIMSVANSKIRALQIDLSRMEDISQEFNKISRQLTNKQRVNIIEKNITEMQEKMNENNSKLSEMVEHQKELMSSFGHHTEILKKMHIRHSAQAKTAQKQLAQLIMEMKNYHLEVIFLAKQMNEQQHGMLRKEKATHTNMVALFEEIRHARSLQKTLLFIISFGGILLAVLLVKNDVNLLTQINRMCSQL